MQKKTMINEEIVDLRQKYKRNSNVKLPEEPKEQTPVEPPKTKSTAKPTQLVITADDAKINDTDSLPIMAKKIKNYLINTYGYDTTFYWYQPAHPITGDSQFRIFQIKWKDARTKPYQLTEEIVDLRQKYKRNPNIKIPERPKSKNNMQKFARFWSPSEFSFHRGGIDGNTPSLVSDYMGIKYVDFLDQELKQLNDPDPTASALEQWVIANWDNLVQIYQNYNSFLGQEEMAGMIRRAAEPDNNEFEKYGSKLTGENFKDLARYAYRMVKFFVDNYHELWADDSLTEAIVDLSGTLFEYN